MTHTETQMVGKNTYKITKDHNVNDGTEFYYVSRNGCAAKFFNSWNEVTQHYKVLR